MNQMQRLLTALSLFMHLPAAVARRQDFFDLARDPVNGVVVTALDGGVDHPNRSRERVGLVSAATGFGNGPRADAVGSGSHGLKVTRLCFGVDGQLRRERLANIGLFAVCCVAAPVPQLRRR
jgi:hypothetical protein